MADILDQAQDSLEREEQAAQAARQAQAAWDAAHAPDPTGECLNPLCGEPLDPVPDGHGGAVMPLFCGPACAKEHAKRVK